MKWREKKLNKDKKGENYEIPELQLDVIFFPFKLESNIKRWLV